MKNVIVDALCLQAELEGEQVDPSIGSNDYEKMLDWLKQREGATFLKMIAWENRAEAMKLSRVFVGDLWEDGNRKGELEGKRKLYRWIRSLRTAKMQTGRTSHVED